MESRDMKVIGEEFLTFTLAFHQIFKNKFQKKYGVKANSLAFHALMLLKSLDEQPLTMSALAGQLDITKQQLTRLINVMEEQGLVERSHDTRNRRQVYVQVTDKGRRIVSELCEQLLLDMVQSLSSLEEQELSELRVSVSSLSRLLEKMDGPNFSQ